MEREPELWIGLVHLRPLKKGGLDGCAGAYTNIITWACDIGDFRKNAETIAATLDLYVLEVDEAEQIEKRFGDSTLSEELEDMRSRAEHNPNAIVYGTFHTYPFDDA